MPIHKFGSTKPIVEPKSTQEILKDAGIPNVLEGRKINLVVPEPLIKAKSIEKPIEKPKTNIISHPDIKGSLEIIEEEL